MILINPVHTVTNGVVSSDYTINLAFANKLYTALTDKGESCLLPIVNGEYVPDTAYSKIIKNNSFDIIFHIKCLHDIGPDVKGFSIECNKYTALVNTIRAEFIKWGSTSIYPAGYTISTTATTSTNEDLAEITLGLGFVTNNYDYTKLTDSDSLQDLINRIVSAAYSPPIRSTQLTDNIGIPDPYFEVDTSAEGDSTALTKGWSEVTSTRIQGDKSHLISSTIDSVPVHILEVVTPSTTRISPLTWRTRVEDNFLNKDCVMILSYRMHNKDCSFSVELNNVTKTYAYSTSTWTTVNFNVNCDEDNRIFSIYFPANSSIDIAAVWLMQNSVLGSLDDPMTKYSLYPPEYQPTTSVDLESIAAYNGTVSTSSTLLSRAKDLMTSALTVSSLTTALSKIDQITLSSDTLAKATSGIVAALSSSATAAKLIDLKSITTEYSIMQASLSSVMRSDRKAALINAINTIKGVAQAKDSITKTLEEKKAEAEKKAAAIRARVIAKGEAMSK